MAAVRREVILETPREEVWRALTQPERLREWFANDVELDVRPGGEGTFRWGDGSARRASVEAVEAERRLAFTWHDEADGDGGETHVELALEDAPEGTRLTVIESLTSGSGPRASALAGEWSWGIAWLAALPRLRRLATV
jgi:uncharacterized protein YndB with AHSA1/START domain